MDSSDLQAPILIGDKRQFESPVRRSEYVVKHSRGDLNNEIHCTQYLSLLVNLTLRSYMFTSSIFCAVVDDAGILTPHRVESIFRSHFALNDITGAGD